MNPKIVGTHGYDGYRLETTLEPSKETGATGNDETTIDFYFDTLPNEINKIFLSEATKEDLTKNVIATTKRKN